MDSKPGRPKGSGRLSESLLMRIDPKERAAFQEAATIAGIPLSTWARERLRRAAVRELEDAGRRIAFLE